MEGVQGQLHHAKCIYNALSDIKPEVENVIKLGRKIVDSEESPSTEADSSELTGKIDALKADFNDVGKQITEAKKVLEKALGLAESLHEHLTTVQVNLSPWFFPKEMGMRLWFIDCRTGSPRRTASSPPNRL